MPEPAPRNPHLEMARLARRLARLASVHRPELLDVATETLRRFQPCSPGPGFACVRWFGQLFSFTPNQSRIVEILWSAQSGGTPEVRQERLLDNAGIESGRLVDVFKDHPAWNTMIVAGSTRGTYRIAEL